MSPHPLLTHLRSRLAEGLRRQTATTCAKWAETYRVMGGDFPGPWRWDHHPWLREMHNACDQPYRWQQIIGMKGAQLGFTEWALNVALKSIDINCESILYILPASTPDAHNFSTSRFDPAIEASDHLKNLFTDVSNVGHKRAGLSNLFIRGSRSRSQMKSLPVDKIIFDELDEMILRNVTLAWERMSGRREKLALYISTPTVDGIGIANMYKYSTMDVFTFQCPHCGKHTELIWPDCMVITADSIHDEGIRDSHLRCKECHQRLEHDTKKDWLRNGEWVSRYRDRLDRGFHINQLYSMTVRPVEIATRYLKAQTNQADLQEFYNSKIGVTYTAPDARITDQLIADCRGTTTMRHSSPPGIVTFMGVDVGSDLHYEIDQCTLNPAIPTTDINLMTSTRIVEVGKVKDFEGRDGLDGVMARHNVLFCVIDRNPETRKAMEFAQRHYGRVAMCLYARGEASAQQLRMNTEQLTVNVDRTSWMDLAFGRFHSNKRISIPLDTPLDWSEHLKTPARVYKYDANGNAVAHYVSSENEADHYAHARVYAEIALMLGCSILRNENLGNVV